jgi:hypothetical protein
MRIEYLPEAVFVDCDYEVDLETFMGLLADLSKGIDTTYPVDFIEYMRSKNAVLQGDGASITKGPNFQDVKAEIDWSILNAMYNYVVEQKK